MNDVATADGASSSTGTPDTTTAAAPEAEREPPAAVLPPAKQAQQKKKAEAPRGDADPMFFSMLLRTQRLLEKDLRAQKISSLRIV